MCVCVIGYVSRPCTGRSTNVCFGGMGVVGNESVRTKRGFSRAQKALRKEKWRRGLESLSHLKGWNGRAAG